MMSPGVGGIKLKGFPGFLKKLIIEKSKDFIKFLITVGFPLLKKSLRSNPSYHVDLSSFASLSLFTKKLKAVFAGLMFKCELNFFRNDIL